MVARHLFLQLLDGAHTMVRDILGKLYIVVFAWHKINPCLFFFVSNNLIESESNHPCGIQYFTLIIVLHVIGG